MLCSSDQVIPPNSGRDSAPVFVRRGKLPKNIESVKQPGVQTDRTVLNVFGPMGHGGRYILDSLKVRLAWQDSCHSLWTSVMRQVLNCNILISLNVLDCCCCFVFCMCLFDPTGMFPLTSLSVLGCFVFSMCLFDLTGMFLLTSLSVLAVLLLFCILYVFI